MDQCMEKRTPRLRDGRTDLQEDGQTTWWTYLGKSQMKKSTIESRSQSAKMDLRLLRIFSSKPIEFAADVDDDDDLVSGASWKCFFLNDVSFAAPLVTAFSSFFDAVSTFGWCCLMFFDSVDREASAEVHLDLSMRKLEVTSAATVAGERQEDRKKVMLICQWRGYYVKSSW